MCETYYIYAQKVGTKSFGGKPFIIPVKENGKIAYGNYRGEEAKPRIAIMIKDLQESGAYSRVAIKEGDKRGYIYDWRMEAEKAQVQAIELAEYQRKRKELKAQIAELEAQIAKLDKEWLD